MTQPYKSIGVGESCSITYNRNPIGKIKAIINYAQYLGKYFDIQDQNSQKKLLVRRIK